MKLIVKLGIASAIFVVLCLIDLSYEKVLFDYSLGAI